jgi:2-dehydropantoate 2-reductase
LERFTMPTRILVVGAGAIGAFYASRLACAPNVKVAVVCRSNLRAVNSTGFRISSPNYGEYTFRPHAVFGSPAQAATDHKQPWDYVVVATKSLPDVSDDSAVLEGLIGPKCSIVLVQNGVGIEQPFVTRFPQTTIITAVTIANAAQVQPGHIKHHAWTRISLGPFLERMAVPTAEEAEEQAMQSCSRFVELLRAGGVADAEAFNATTMQLIRWHKCAINAAMNPTAVLAGCADNPTISNDLELGRHVVAVMKEILAVASKVTRSPIPPFLPSPEQVLTSSKRSSPGSKPSMLIDFEAGRPMELEVILGNPLRLARAYQLDIPRVESMYALLKGIQSGRGPRSRL